MRPHRSEREARLLAGLVSAGELLEEKDELIAALLAIVARLLALRHVERLEHEAAMRQARALADASFDDLCVALRALNMLMERCLDAEEALAALGAA